MAMLLRIWAMFVLAVKRLLSQPGLALASLLGIASASVLVMSVPLYVDAVHYRMFRAELSGPLVGKGRPPFTFVYHYLGGASGPLELDDVQPADQYLSTVVPSELGLLQMLHVRSLKTPRLGLFSRGEANYDNPLARLTTVSLAHITDLEEHITILDGLFPTAPFAEDGSLNVLLSGDLAQKTGFQVGETYVLFKQREFENIQFSVRIAGVWQPADPDDMFWFRDPTSFEDVLFVSEASFAWLLEPERKVQINEALWYQIYDDADLKTTDVGPLIVRITRIQAIAGGLLPKVIVSSPLDALSKYYWSERSLTLQLYVLLVPIIVLNMLFTGLVTGMLIQRRRREIAVLRSRGANQSQVIGMAVLEGFVLGALGLALSLPASTYAAQMATRTRSFMDFARQSEVRVGFSRAALPLGGLATGFALLTHTLPTIAATRHTIVSYRLERARMLRPPLWQRFGLDLMLLIPAAYGTFLLRQQGTLFVPMEGIEVSDPFQNPLLVLIPSLTLFALTLLTMRILPLLVKGLAWLASQTRSVSFLLAVRHLARTPGFYTAPMVLLIVTLSLSVFLSAMAQTLDDHLRDQMRYQNGAPLVLRPLVETGGDEEGGDSAPAAAEGDIPNWYYIPLPDYLEVPGVRQAARVDRFRARFNQGGDRDQGTLMGVDRVSFAQVAYWRPDFAAENLGSLMNRLAAAHNGVLLPRAWMRGHAVGIGDTIRVTISAYGQEAEFVLTAVGGFDLFPTWNPQYGPLFVVNLDHVYETIGIELPAALWIVPEPGADTEQVRGDLGRLNPFSAIQPLYFVGLAAEQGRPERQGLLGILSIGFVSAALLATVGFFLYTLFSFERRSIELGTLKSMGLSFQQMARYLAWELVFLVLVGLVGGTALGALVSRLWIPYFRIGSKAFSDVLPMSVRFSWSAVSGIYALFGALLVVILGMSITLSSRLRLFEDVKMLEMT